MASACSMVGSGREDIRARDGHAPVPTPFVTHNPDTKKETRSEDLVSFNVIPVRL